MPRPRHKRRLTAALLGATLVALAACAKDTAKGATTVKLAVALRGKPVAALSVGELRKLGDARVVVDDPHEHGTLTLQGVAASAVFDAEIGPSWRTAEDVVFTCGDGFRPTIPVRAFLERDAYFAYARADAAEFTVEVEPGKRVAVGPYYLVWKKAPGDDPPEPRWPYQVSAVEVTDAETELAPATPPDGADARAKDGFARFRTFCMPCHTMNGRGGRVGPELNYPVSVTEYFSDAVLRRWIADPSAVRWNSKMPAPLPDDADRANAIDAIVTYLDAMAKKKIAPPAP